MPFGTLIATLLAALVSGSSQAGAPGGELVTLRDRIDAIGLLINAAPDVAAPDATANKLWADANSNVFVAVPSERLHQYVLLARVGSRRTGLVLKMSEKGRAVLPPTLLRQALELDGTLSDDQRAAAGHFYEELSTELAKSGKATALVQLPKGAATRLELELDAKSPTVLRMRVHPLKAGKFKVREFAVRYAGGGVAKLVTHANGATPAPQDWEEYYLAKTDPSAKPPPPLMLAGADEAPAAPVAPPGPDLPPVPAPPGTPPAVDPRGAKSVHVDYRGAPLKEVVSMLQVVTRRECVPDVSLNIPITLIGLGDAQLMEPELWDAFRPVFEANGLTFDQTLSPIIITESAVTRTLAQPGALYARFAGPDRALAERVLRALVSEHGTVTAVGPTLLVVADERPLLGRIQQVVAALKPSPVQPPPVDNSPLCESQSTMRGVTPAGEGRVRVSPDVWHEFLKDSERLSQQAVFTMSISQDKQHWIEGVEVSRIKPDSLLCAIGLQNGDVIQRVNDYPLDPPYEPLTVDYKAAAKAGKLHLEVKRQGVRVKLDLMIVAP